MGQKVLAAHAEGPWSDEGLLEVRVDQVILAQQPSRVVGAALEGGLERCAPEVCVAYSPYCTTLSAADADRRAPHRVPAEAVALGLLVAQPGAGFAAAVHVERFASPARLALSDEPRLSSCGAVGMLCLPASRSQLVEALSTGKTTVRAARSIVIFLTGRLRPFVSARDVALDLTRRGLAQIIQHIDATFHAPVVLEFAGASCKFLSVNERAVLCSLAPRLGAAAAVFGSDEKTELFLRDQKRSKAYRSLAADSGAPFEDVLNVDLAGIDPLLEDEEGRIRPVREREGSPVSQVLLGGDSGISLRDLLAVAALLKSKRVAPGVEFLLCPPSRQALEVLARSDALADLLSTGARLIEADRRSLSGDLYRPVGDGLCLRNADHEGKSVGVIASTETLAFATVSGKISDPRQFKRPVRVALPRLLPTDDVLMMRGAEARGGAKGKGRVDKRALEGSIPPPTSENFAEAPPSSWKGPLELKISTSADLGAQPKGPLAFLGETLDDVRYCASTVADRADVRAVIAPHIPAALVSILSGMGIVALCADPTTLSRLQQVGFVHLPSPQGLKDEITEVQVTAENELLTLKWLAVAQEREWTLAKSEH